MGKKLSNLEQFLFLSCRYPLPVKGSDSPVLAVKVLIVPLLVDLVFLADLSYFEELDFKILEEEAVVAELEANESILIGDEKYLPMKPRACSYSPG